MPRLRRLGSRVWDKSAAELIEQIDDDDVVIELRPAAAAALSAIQAAGAKGILRNDLLKATGIWDSGALSVHLGNIRRKLPPGYELVSEYAEGYPRQSRYYLIKPQKWA